MIAVVPPGDLRERIEQERMEFAANYNCKAALKPPVHITLIAPFKAIEPDVQKLAGQLKLAAREISPFQVKLSGYRAFERNGVIYIHVPEEPALKQLHKVILTPAKKAAEESINTFSPYTPHITIGYRDIPKELFPAAMEEYKMKRFEAAMPVNHFELWKHNGHNWQAIAQFPLLETAVAPTLF